MKLDKSANFLLLGFCLFCGIVVISLGVGSELTALNTVMSPLICGTDQLQAAWEYNVSGAGPTVYDSRWVCVNKASDLARDASLKTNLMAGSVYGLLLFAGLLSWSMRAGIPSLKKT